MKISVVLPTNNLVNIGKTIEYWGDADEIIIAYDPKKEVVDNSNEGMKRAKGDIIVWANDRVVIRQDWRKIIVERLRGLVSFAPYYATNFVATREYIEKYQNGYLIWPEYIHHYADLEIAEKAKKVELYDEIADMLFCLPKKKREANERKALRQLQWDMRTYWRRSKLGFPDKITCNMKEREKHIYVY